MSSKFLCSPRVSITIIETEVQRIINENFGENCMLYLDLPHTFIPFFAAVKHEETVI